MKLWVKWLLIVAGTVVALLLTALILVKVLLTPERVRATVQPLAQQALGRELRLGEIEIGLFSGVTLRHCELLEADGREVFAAIDALVLRYQFWPLLRGQVVIDEIRVEQPTLRIVRYADGHFNFDDLLARSESPQTPPAAPAEPGRKLDLRIARLQLQGGSVEFVDLAIDPQAPLRMRAEELSLSARELTLTRPFPYELGLRYGAATLAASGTLDATQRSATAALKLQGLDLTVFAPYYARSLPGRLAKLRLDLDLALAGDSRQLTAKGKAVFADIDLALDALGADAPLHGTLSIDHDLRLEPQAQLLELNTCRLDFNGLVLDLHGSVRDYERVPQLDLTASLPGLDLRKLSTALPQRLTAPLRPYDPSGELLATLHLAGSSEKPRELLRDGTFQFEQVAVSVAGVRAGLGGRLLLRGDTLRSEGLRLRLAESELAVDLSGEQLLDKVPRLQLAVTGDRVVLDPLLNGQPSGNTAAAPAASAATEAAPLDLPLAAQATLRIQKLLWRGLVVDTFDLRARLEHNVLGIERLYGRVADGSVSASARVDLAKPGYAYTASLDLRKLAAGPLLASLEPRAAGTLSGQLDLNLNLGGKGTVPETLRRNLDGSGTFALHDGKLSGGGLAQGLSGFLGVADPELLHFRDFGGNLRVRQGQVLLEASFSGDQLRLRPHGAIGLDGALDLGLDTRLAPALTTRLAGKGDLGRVLSDEQGWGRLPLRVKGTLAAPRFTLDSSAVGREVEDLARRKLERVLEKKLGKPKGSGEGETGQEKQPELEKALRDLLRR